MFSSSRSRTTSSHASLTGVTGRLFCARCSFGAVHSSSQAAHTAAAAAAETTDSLAVQRSQIVIAGKATIVCTCNHLAASGSFHRIAYQIQSHVAACVAAIPTAISPGTISYISLQINRNPYQLVPNGNQFVHMSSYSAYIHNHNREIAYYAGVSTDR